MKKFVLFTLALIHFFLFSQTQWQDNGIPVYCGENVNWTGTTINSDDGNMVIFWSDSRNGDRGIFAQKITPDGTFLWGETGREINDDLDTQYHPEATTSLNNEIIIAWVSHYGNFDIEIRVQKIDANGNRLWQDEGILLFTGNEIFPYRIQIVDDLVGGAFVVWRNFTLEPDPITVKGLHILADGSIDSNWNAGGNIFIQNLNYHNFYILPDGYGGLMYAFGNQNDLYIQRIGSNGNTLWGDEGIILCEDTVSSYYLGVTSDNEGLFYLFWEDSRNANSNSIYMQKVDINGNSMFPDDINVYDVNYSNIKVAYTSEGSLALSWTGSSNNQFFLKTLKLDTSGNVLITPIDIYNGVYSCGNIDIIADNTGGYWLKWFYHIGYVELYVQHINISGEITLEENGLFICEAWLNYFLITLNLSSDNRAFLSWVDESTRSNTLYAQVVDDLGNLQFPEDGLIIHEGPSGYISDLEIIPHEDNPFFLWINNKDYGESHIFAQSLDSDGSPVFEENGIPIMQSFSSDFEEYDVDHQNNIFSIITNELIDNWRKAVAQSFDSDGNLLWGENGIFVTNSDCEQYNVQISSLESFIYAGWSEYNWLNPAINIFAQKLDANGNLLWDEAGVLITEREGNDNLQDVLGRCYIWQNECYQDYNIYAKLLDENGNTAPGWDENGTSVSVADGIQNLPAGLQIPQGYLIIWRDHRDSEHDIYGQIITEEGNILWQQDGLPLVAQSGVQQYFSFQFDDYLYLVWQDYRSGNYSEIYAQKFDENGNELWQPGGVLIGEGERPDIAKIGDQLVVVWGKYGENGFTDIYAQLISLEGEILWNPAGIVLCDASWDQRKPQIVTNESNDVYIGWLDDRIINYSPYGDFVTSVFAQKIHIEPTFSPDGILNAITAKLHQNSPNPFNPETKIIFDLPEAGRVKLEIYNIKGKKIKTLLDCHMNPGKSEMIWNGRDENDQSVSSGVYFYRLKTGNFEKSKKMVLLK